ncbi:hypothetical protein ASE00_07240 [Sphingomonas sp. Root710]|uniref:hypothetical protein n=1 Tax=Sphingomonas sp. Root710 TaxID=1736594 RepID=UPI0006F3516F|nr:hypothetical protein [Sphingomonas sp. Root710]KRB86485.1 hypothetical protein ASE00_07240 [Sphingomonas sp. Root710]
MKNLRWLLLLLGGLVALSADAEAALTVSKTQSTVWDTENKFVLPKAIPGARVEYVITVSNALFQSTARNVTITDAIPAKTKFYVGSVVVTIGALSSLTYPTGGALEYSSDNGSTWTYTPSAGSDGSDSNVTNIRVKVGGSQVAGDSFTVAFRAVVK